MPTKRTVLLLALAGRLTLANGYGSSGDASVESNRDQESGKASDSKTGSATRKLLGRSTPLRNENRHVSAYDNQVSTERLEREGMSPNLLDQPSPTPGGFGAELSRPVFLGATEDASDQPRGAELFWTHQNSVFNARNFFQVGEVQPARFNQYGTRLSSFSAGPFLLSGDWEQLKSRGTVNGNVLVPLPEERIPRSGDPLTDAKIRRFLAAFPNLPPNLPDVSPRSLNTNSAQDVDDTKWSLWVSPSRRKALSYNARYTFSQTDIDAFELVAGQNPDTRLRSQQFRGSLLHERGAADLLSQSFTFQRQRTFLLPTESAVGPQVGFSKELTTLGPQSIFPIRRFRNGFSYEIGLSKKLRLHDLQWGGELSRAQINDFMEIVGRGRFTFSANFGRSAVDNFLHGTPTAYRVSLGDLYRGFREWSGSAYGLDRIRLRPDLTLSLGVRWEFFSQPAEVNRRTRLPFDGDFNNIAPRLGLAFRQGPWVLRAGYGISYGTIYYGLYQQARANPPEIQIIEVDKPNFLDPFSSVPLQELASGRSAVKRLHPGLTSPYSHQYSLSWETALPGGLSAKAGYVGSRTLKLFFAHYGNRGQPVPGIPTTTKTINDRRPDPQHFDVKETSNSGVAYLDALNLSVQRTGGNLAFRASYSFGKVLDTGTTFLTTGFGEADGVRSQTEFGIHQDLKGPSDFDTRHGFELVYFCQLPTFSSGSPWRRFFSGWAVLGSVLFKSGTPFTIFTGSDAPGFGNVDGEAGDRPHLLDPSLLGKSVDHPDRAASILRSQAFDPRLSPGTGGTLGRNTFRKDGTNNFNLGLVRRVPLPSFNNASLQFRGEIFNLLNHAQFDSPGQSLSNLDFGLITNTLNNGRVIQLSLRLAF